MVRRLALTFGIYALIAASAAAQGKLPGSDDPDMKEIAAYRLTMPTFHKVVQATKNMAEAAKNDPRFKKEAALKAEIKKLEDKDELSEAEGARLEKLREELDQAESGNDASENPKTLAEMAAAIDKEPAMRKALADAGMTSREFAKFTLAYLQAGMVAGMMKGGLIKEVPKDLAATINMENVKFVQEHAAELEALGKAMKAAEDK